MQQLPSGSLLPHSCITRNFHLTWQYSCSVSIVYLSEIIYLLLRKTSRIICIDINVCLGKITTPKLILGHVFLLQIRFYKLHKQKTLLEVGYQVVPLLHKYILVGCLESIILQQVFNNQVIFTDWLHLAIIHIVAYALTLLSSSRKTMNLLMKKERFTRILKVLPF